MNRNYLLILPLTLSVFFACKNSRNNTYIISKEDSIRKISNTRPDGSVLMSPVGLQGLYNFLIDSNENIYYYSFQEMLFDGATHDEIDFNNAAFMHLKPNCIFKIPKGYEKRFFEENVLNLRSYSRIKDILVGSEKDTIKSEFISYLKKIDADTSKRISLTIRRTIQEEKETLKYKIKGQFYDHSNIKWDSTKITFE